MISTARISRLRRAADAGDVDALVNFFAGHGWGTAVGEVHAEVGISRLVELSWGDESQALLVVAADKDESVASWGYSREAPYSLAWHSERLALFDSRYWRETPGDSPLMVADPGQRWAVDELLALLRPEQLLEDIPGSYGEPEKRQRELHDTLAEALAALRLQIAQAGLLEDIEPVARDAEVLRLFHQLLFIRFQEDRDRAASEVRLRDLPAAQDVRASIARALEDYRSQLNSELFAPVRINVEDLPSAPLGGVVKQLVEPWTKLRLNFSVSRSEIAGRLYQSYLSSLPTKKPQGAQGAFFADAHAVDQQAEHGSYYTPPGLARLVVERTLVPWLKSRKPVDPSEVRILDPACGSGAFLIAGYRTLLEYFSEQKGSELTADERTQILLESVFGADVDERALDLARVQLLEEADVGGRLPVLGKNLLLGDSLLSPPGASALPGAVDWRAANIGDRGFDAVLTNPPFLTRYKRSAKLTKEESKHLAELYPQVDISHADHASLFIELALRLIGENGVAGFVLPASIVKAGSGAAVRKRLAEQGLRSVVDFGAGRLFDADTYVCTVSTGRTRSTELLRATDLSRDGRVLLEAAERKTPELMRHQRISRRLIAAEATDGWDVFRLRWKLELSKEVEAELEVLGAEGRKVRYGTKPGNQGAFTVEPDEWTPVDGNKFAVDGHRIPGLYLPRLVKGGHLASPFFYSDNGQRLFLPYDVDGSLSQLPDVAAELERRGGLPAHPQRGDLDVLRSPKILLRTLTPEITAVADLVGDLMPLMGEAGAIAVQIGGSDTTTLLAYEALLNSAFYQWWLGGMAIPRQGGWLALNVSLVEASPVPRLAKPELDRLCDFANEIRETLALENELQRLRRYRELYERLDQFVLSDLLGASPHLRATVGDEVRRVV